MREYKSFTDLNGDTIGSKLTELTVCTKVVSSEQALADVKRNVRSDVNESDDSLRIKML